MAGWATVGWDDVESSDNSSQEKKKYGPRNFWVPTEKTKRVLFLDGDPFCFYEHNLWSITRNAGDKAICLKKNGLDDRGCPLCESEMWPSFVGYFSIIDMGDVVRKAEGVTLEGWTSDKGITYQFDRKLLGAKRGGKDKPGVLKKLSRLAQKHGGSLVGTVWDVYRSGAKTESVGDEWEFVEKIEPGDWKEFLIGQGANPEYLEVSPVDYVEHFTPHSHDELGRLIGTQSVDGSGARVDDGVPF